MVREFILFSRQGRTDSDFASLRDAGRLDVVHECAVASLFLSHGLRRDVIFHAVLNGPPKPPVHVQIDGRSLYDVRTDQQTWTAILKNILSGKPHAGIKVDRTSFEALVKARAESASVYVLEEGGEELGKVTVDPNPVFVLGDHIGLPKTVERYALRYGTKISLGKQPYLAAHCITILNHHLDKKYHGT